MAGGGGEKVKVGVPPSEDDHHQEQEMEVVVDAAIGGSREGKTSGRNRRRREKKSPRRIQRATSVEEEEWMTEEEGELWQWHSHCRYWSHCLTLRFASVPPMSFTKGPFPAYAIADHALQIQVTEVKDDVEWPLHVYGWVATRDSVDPKRNLLFNRTRDNCQVLTQQDSYLQLTGSSRAVVFIDPVTFQHNMPAYYEDKPYLIHKCCSSKRSTIEVTYAAFHKTVEATVVRVQVTDGSWPDHLRGLVVCRTTSLDKGDIMLLDSRDGAMPIACDGAIELSRRVASVEVKGQLSVDVVASQIDDKSDVVAKDRAVFRYTIAGTSAGRCDLGFFEATVVRVQVTDGSWPDRLRGRVVCRTTCLHRGDIMLLDSRDGAMPVACDGAIELSRRVVSLRGSERAAER
ncbi:hypothetical protein C2845_PM02G32490 [Panicum miliaceum]|uniref:DUF6598 domain-containing protein n=1 Tax=Panicum miliaceum TaxID=4540 RepID=A0A3L6SDF9_PANMI|nr:hypothetical protein C2845_PM02G32490 [Panicum miliaceum]